MNEDAIVFQEPEKEPDDRKKEKKHQNSTERSKASVILTDSSFGGGRSIWGYFFAVITALLFLFIFARASSPLYRSYLEFDSSLYSLLGRAITQGKLMYSDYFDIKGPVFFFMEALGQLLAPGRQGVFIIECLALIVAVVFMCLICELFSLSKKGGVFAFFLFFFIYSVALWAGNTAEEFILPFDMACLFFGARYIRTEKGEPVSTFICGLTLAVCALSKATTAGVAIGVLVSLFIVLIRKGDKAKVLRGLLFFAAGVLVIILPVFTYYLVKGNLSAMLYWTFAMALKRGVDTGYSEASGLGFDIGWELMLLPCYFGIVYGIYMAKKKAEGLMIAVTGLVVLVFMHLGTPFLYYLISVLPLLFFGLASAGGSWNDGTLGEPFKALCVLVMVGLVFACGGSVYSEIQDNMAAFLTDEGFRTEAVYRQLCEQIPPEERSDVECVSPGIRFFEANGLLPANRYIANMTYFGMLDPEVKGEIVGELSAGKHKWLYFESGLVNVFDEDIDRAISSAYISEAEYGNMKLWKRKE